MQPLLQQAMMGLELRVAGLALQAEHPGNYAPEYAGYATAARG